MKKLSKVLAVLFFAGAATLPAQAAPHDVSPERLKTELNEMVQEVKQAETAPAKRAVMERFLEKAERNARLAGYLSFYDAEKSEALKALQAKFDGYQTELRGLNGNDPLADDDLNAFAGFVQQDMEQAAVNGVYLSTGAIIIILLILILVL